MKLSNRSPFENFYQKELKKKTTGRRKPAVGAGSLVMMILTMVLLPMLRC